MAFLLDTNVFAALSRPKLNRRVERSFEKHAAEVCTSAIVIHEMWFGVERMPASRRREELERFMREVVAGVRVLPYGERAARWHASERTRLEAMGHPIALADGQIAATAAINDATLVSANVDHFEVFEGLRVESWT
jgi:tRNA(fMet)-specific endonuclease VapC